MTWPRNVLVAFLLSLMGVAPSSTHAHGEHQEAVYIGFATAVILCDIADEPTGNLSVGLGGACFTWSEPPSQIRVTIDDLAFGENIAFHYSFIDAASEPVFPHTGSGCSPVTIEVPDDARIRGVRITVDQLLFPPEPCGDARKGSAGVIGLHMLP